MQQFKAATTGALCFDLFKNSAPQVGLELTNLRWTAGYSDREAGFQTSRPTSVSQSCRCRHAWNSSVRFIGDCAAWELV